MGSLARRTTCVAAAALVLAAIFATPALAAPGFVRFDSVERLAGSDRYSTSVRVAREAFPGWAGVNHVVVASGDRGLADALAASGLCWAYDAPLLLVSTSGVPSSVLGALGEIASANPTVTIHAVGGTAPLPDSVLAAASRAAGDATVDRIAGVDRYYTAAEVARRMAAVAQETSRSAGPEALIANGADAGHSTDALVCAAISASAGKPLLLVRPDAIPPATERALRDLGLTERYVAGGPKPVSSVVVSALGARRLAGPDRYSTATAIARKAVAEGWVGGGTVGIAGTVVDSLSGAGLMARLHSAVLLTRTGGLPNATVYYLDDLPRSTAAYVLGGERVVGSNVVRELEGFPAEPVFTGLPAGTDYAGSRVPARLAVGVNTERVRIYHDGRMVAERQVTPFSTVDLGYVSVSGSRDEIKAVAYSDAGNTGNTLRVRPLGYPWSTYIVVDKSEFRLYFVKGGVLEDWYPVAHGKHGCTPAAIWRIDAKYYTSPTSVYGPRKMRLFRQVSPGRFVFTAYGIHGTNQPWVIGTEASHGCIRMYNSDVLELFPRVPLHTMVVTRE
ncbi:MAG: hypothetical protein Kow0056_12190 [Coriobacteriia bacterium]